VILALALLGLAVVNLVSTPRGRSRSAGGEAAEQGPSHDHGKPGKIPDVEEFGPKDAPIEIVAYYPRPSADAESTLTLLRRLVAEYDPHLRVKAVNIATRKGRREAQGPGLPEDGLTVNGRRDFARVVSGNLRKIEFSEAVYPTGSRWREADLRALINLELRHQHLYAKKYEQELESLKTGQTYSVGNPQSKVRVKAYYPMPEQCVDVTFKVLKEVAEEYKDRVYFEFIDTVSDDGFTEWCDAHTLCHGILIDGKQEYEVTVNGETKKVTFFAPLDTEWTRAELEAALNAELAAVGQ